MLFLKMNNLTKRVVTILILTPISFIIFFFFPIICFFSFTIIIYYILIYEWPKVCPYNSWKNIAKTIFYPVISWLMVIYWYITKPKILAALIAYTSIFDTSCYCIGNLFGKNHITPISPKKTWEGLIGGFFISIVITYCIMQYYSPNMFKPSLILKLFFISGFAFFGDLFASWMKRKAQIKDFGSILPGHGGFLDRIDSILFVIPIATIYFIILSLLV